MRRAAADEALDDLLTELVRAEEELLAWADLRSAALAAAERLSQAHPGDEQVAAIAAQLRAVTDQHKAMVEQLRALQRQTLATERGPDRG